MKKSLLLITACVISIGIANAQLLYDNGPLVNQPGAGAGGADVSALHDGLNTLGSGHAVSSGFRVSDDFTIPVGETWTIDSIVFFAYQTNSGNISTITEVNCAVFDASPAGGGNIIFGDTVTSLLSNTYWSGIYRTSSTTLTSTTRPIMRDVVEPSSVWTLTAGTYWLAWQTGGTVASGPWAPLITFPVITVTGDAFQFNPNTSMWNPLIDTSQAGPGDDAAQGLPFEIYGTSLVGVNNITNDGNSISIAPNPSNGTFTVKTDFSKASNLEITISDLRGRVIYQEKLIDVTKLDKKISLTETPKGVYMMKLYNDSGEVIVEKIVID